jgi:hypothetical protein
MSAQVVYRRAATRWLARLLVEGRRATIPRSRFASTRRAFVHIVDEAGTPASATCRQRTAPRGRRRRHRLTPDKRRAIQAGNLALIHATAAELPYVPLEDALGILLVIEAKDDERFERSAVRWAGRLAFETPDLALAELAGALESLHALPDEHAQRSLLALAERARPPRARATAPPEARRSSRRRSS